MRLRSQTRQKNEKLHTGLHSFTGMIWKSLILRKIECCEWDLKFVARDRAWGFGDMILLRKAHSSGVLYLSVNSKLLCARRSMAWRDRGQVPVRIEPASRGARGAKPPLRVFRGASIMGELSLPAD